MTHNGSLPVGDREESPDKYVVRWAGLVVDIFPEEGHICLHVRCKGEDWRLVIDPADVDRVTVNTPFMLPEVFKEVNEALRVCARIARKG